jgi:hypothetical protein
MLSRQLLTARRTRADANPYHVGLRLVLQFSNFKVQF